MTAPEPGSVDKLVQEIDSLIMQATHERSHYYTASVLRKCRDALLAATQDYHECPQCGDQFVDRVLATLREQLRACEQQRARDSKDAERYRWLRDGMIPGDTLEQQDQWWATLGDLDGTAFEQELDATIDAALAAKSEDKD